MQVPPFSLTKQLSELGNDLEVAVSRVIQSGQFIGGDEVKTFEDSFAKSIGIDYSVGCNSGTDALVLALRALDIGIGDEVITSSFSFFATAEAISAVGAKPVFVDVDPCNYLIDLNLIEQAITSSTKAILPVHLFGCPVDMKTLNAIAKKNGLKVIEDCAQAAGAEYEGMAVGSWGDIGCFSFFPTKNLGGVGDGGAVTTRDAGLAKRMRELAVHGMPARYLHTQLGYNSRLDALQAAVLNVKLPKLKYWVKKRQQIAQRYIDLLEDLPGLDLPKYSSDMNTSHAWNQFVVRVTDFSIKAKETDAPKVRKSLYYDRLNNDNNARDEFKDALLRKGVNTIIYYPIPIHLQPAYESLGFSVGDLPITEMLCGQVLSLPIFPEISEEQQEYVSLMIRNLFS